MKLGQKYLNNEKYDEAILQFNKVIQIEDKNIPARVGKSKGYIGKDDIDNAVKSLREAQNLDIKSESLILEIIDILKNVNPQETFDMLQRYLNAIGGQNNASEKIKELLKTSLEDPAMPVIEPVSGVYIKAFSAKFTIDKLRIGHMIYYTTDGSNPSKNSKLYTKPIKIKDSSTKLKIIAFNPKGVGTEIQEVEYIIKPELETQIKSVIAEASKEYDNTKEGTAVGNCVQGSKAVLKNAIESVKSELNKSIISEAHAKELIQYLNDQLDSFKDKIIPQTDKEALSNSINRGNNLLSKIVEGNSVGNYRDGTKSKLKYYLDKAITVRDNILAKQTEIDSAQQELDEAINRCENSKLTEADIILQSAGAKVGKVTVSLLWNSTDDLDLHVISPLGDEISYQNKQSSISGGMLDVDRQVSSFVQNPIENIYWDNPPRGHYTVKVVAYQKRESNTATIKVRVINGDNITHYDATISSSEYGVDICSFDY